MVGTATLMTYHRSLDLGRRGCVWTLFWEKVFDVVFEKVIERIEKVNLDCHCECKFEPASAEFFFCCIVQWLPRAVRQRWNIRNHLYLRLLNDLIDRLDLGYWHMVHSFTNQGRRRPTWRGLAATRGHLSAW